MDSENSPDNKLKDPTAVILSKYKEKSRQKRATLNEFLRRMYIERPEVSLSPDVEGQPNVQKRAESPPLQKTTSADLPEFGTMERTLRELQSCYFRRLDLKLALRREGQQQDFSLHSKMKGMPTEGKAASSQETKAAAAPAYGPLERALRELQNYSTPVQSLKIDASLHQDGAERTIELKTKTIDLVVERLPPLTPKDKSALAATSGWILPLTLLPVGLAIGYALFYLCSSPVPSIYQKDMAPPHSQPKEGKTSSVTRPSTSPLSAPEKTPKEHCQEVFHLLYKGSAEKNLPNFDLARKKVMELASSCRETTEISQILAAAKEQPLRYFQAPEITFSENDSQRELWRKSFQESFGEKAVLYSGDPESYQMAVHLGYTPIPLDPLVQRILLNTVIPTDKEVALNDP